MLKGRFYYSEGENFCFEYGDWREAFLRRFKRYLNGLNVDRQFRTRGILETFFLTFGIKGTDWGGYILRGCEESYNDSGNG